MRRRRFCLAVGTALAAVAGCQDAEPSGTPTAVGDDGPESFLPATTGDWTFRGTREHDPGWSPLGAEDGVVGRYLGPDDTAHEFVVVETREQYTRGTARSLACAGWQVALAVDGYALAASTGTTRRTFTPEAPPTMTRSPVPGSDESVRALLALSPRLDEAAVTEERVDCG